MNLIGVYNKKLYPRKFLVESKFNLELVNEKSPF